MNTRVLVLSPAVREEISKVVQYASAHKLTLEQLKRVGKPGGPASVGDDPGFLVVIPFGYRVCFSIEEHPGSRWCRHLSVSIPERGKLPSIDAVYMLLPEFGFKAKRDGNPDVAAAWVEDLGENDKAINLLEEI